MIPLKPFSVKIPPEVRSKIKEASQAVGYSENQFIVESVHSVLEMISQEGAESLPLIVVLVRAARQNRVSPQKLISEPPKDSESHKKSKSGKKPLD